MKKQFFIILAVSMTLINPVSAIGRQLIQNGTPVVDSTLNKMVPLIYTTSNNNAFICTGTFISPSTVLTAAHCVLDMSQKNVNTPYTINNIHDPKNIKIILSKDPNKPVNLNDSNVQKNINIFVANKIYVHLDAFKGVGVSDKGLNIQDYSQINDLAIIELSNPLDSNAVEIATVSTNNPIIGSEELIIGYGVDNGSGVIINDPFNGASGVLRSAIAKIDSFSGNNYIINLLGTVNNGDGYTHICQGDSGGPDLININNKYTIQGVHSFGQGSECGTPSSPGSSINVAQYYNWIKNDYKNSLLQK